MGTSLRFSDLDAAIGDPPAPRLRFRDLDRAATRQALASATFGPVDGTLAVPTVTPPPTDEGPLGTLTEMYHQAQAPGAAVRDVVKPIATEIGHTLTSGEAGRRTLAAMGRIGTQTLEGGALAPLALPGIARAAIASRDPSYALSHLDDDFGGATDPRVMATREAVRSTLTDPMERALGVTPMSNRPDVAPFDFAAQLVAPVGLEAGAGWLSRKLTGGVTDAAAAGLNRGLTAEPRPTVTPPPTMDVPPEVRFDPVKASIVAALERRRQWDEGGRAAFVRGEGPGFGGELPRAMTPEGRPTAETVAAVADQAPEVAPPEGAAPTEDFSQPPEVTYTDKRKRLPLARRTREDLYHHLTDDIAFAQKNRSGTYIGQSAYGETVVGREQGGLGGHMDREAAKRIDAIYEELARRGETPEQVNANLDAFEEARAERAGMEADQGRGAGWSPKDGTPFSLRSLMNERGALGVPRPPRVLYRGVSETGEGTGLYSLGKGLYSSPSRAFASQYGTRVIEVPPEEGWPKNPLVLRNTAGGASDALTDWLLEKSGAKNIREFNRRWADPGEFVRSLGYDGVVAGDQVVRYPDTPKGQQGRPPLSPDHPGITGGGELKARLPDLRSERGALGSPDPEVDDLGRRRLQKQANRRGIEVRAEGLAPGEPRFTLSDGETRLSLLRDQDLREMLGLANRFFYDAEMNPNGASARAPERAAITEDMRRLTVEFHRRSAANDLREAERAVASATEPKLIARAKRRLGEARKRVREVAGWLQEFEGPSLPSLRNERGALGVPGEEPTPSPLLSGLHNLTEDNLLHADKLGGMAAPSLGIVTEDKALSGFGDITLIGSRDLFDPAQTHVFDADAYTPRNPEPEYPKVRAKKADALMKRLRALAGEHGDDYRHDVYDYLHNRPDPKRAVNELEKSDLGRAAYLAEKGQPIPGKVLRDKPLRMEHLSTDPEIQRWMQERGATAPGGDGAYHWYTQNVEDLSKQVLASVDRYVKRLPAKARGRILENFRDQWVDEEGHVTWPLADRLIEDMQRIGGKEVDTHATGEALKAAITDPADFRQWARRQVEPLYDAPRVRVGRRLEPYNLENLTEATLKPGDVRAKEAGATFGPGAARARASRRISSLTEARNRSTWQMGTEDQVETARKATEAKLEKWREGMLESRPKQSGFFLDTWDALDNMHKGLGEFLAGGARTNTRFRQIMRRYGFTGLSDEVVAQGIDAALGIAEAPVPYFEGKPHRAVKLEEFAGAVIPEDASPEVRAALERRGIPYTTYAKGEEGAQQRATIEFRKQLHAQGKGTLGALGVPNGPGFTSRLVESVKRAKLDKAPAQTWISKLRGQGHSADEFDWALGDALAADPKRQWTRAELLDMAEKRGYGSLTETVRRIVPANEALPLPAGWSVREFPARPGQTAGFEVLDERGKWVAQGDTREGALRNATHNMQMRDVGERPGQSRAAALAPKFSQYTEPGGSNYREIILQSPAVNYTDSHFPGEKGNLAWIRVNDRTGPNGEKILHVEEIQSGLHQKGRKEGYLGVGEASKQEIDAARSRLGRANRALEVAHNQAVEELGYGSPRNMLSAKARDAIDAHPAVIEAGKEFVAADQDLADLLAKGKSGVPDAPFKETPEWMGLAMKRVLDEAVAGGYDQVSWTPGVRQADRYNLRKAADAVLYDPASHHLTVSKNGSVVHSGNYDPAALPDVIGKEAADKLLASPARPASELMDDADMLVDSQRGTLLHSLTGQQLEVGAQSMKAFYDQMLPDWLKGYARKLGVRLDVEPARVFGNAEGKVTIRHETLMEDIEDEASGYGGRQTVGRARGEMIDALGDFAGHFGEESDPTPRTLAEIRDWWDQTAAEYHLSNKWRENGWSIVEPHIVKMEQGETAPSFRVTPELRAAIGKGQNYGAGGVKYLTGLTGAGVGATAGAKIDKDHPIRGAFIGGLAGAALGARVGELIDKTPLAPVNQNPDGFIDGLRRLFAPETRTPQSAMAGRTIRARLGQGALEYAQVEHALLAVGRGVDKLPVTDKMAMIHAIETGAPQADPALQPVADAIRQALDDARLRVQGLGTGKLEHWIDDYFPHIWEDPAAAVNAFTAAQARRPLQGSRAFLKQRTIPTTADGLALGLKPVTDNPIDLALLKIREMNRYVTAHRIMGDLKDQGLLKFERGQVPPGYTTINDNVATVYGPPVVTVPGTSPAQQVPVGGVVIMGRYVAPEPVARLLNNHLAPGLRGNPLFDAYMGLGNSLNQVQLGLSAFHLGFTSMDAATSRTAAAINDLRRGKLVSAAKTAVSVPLAPFTTYLRGSKLMAAALEPGTASAEMLKLVDGLAAGGGRIQMDRFYQNDNVRAFRTAVGRKDWARAAKQVIPAVFERSSRWLMEGIVPRQKLGVFADLASRELAKLPAGASDDAVREAMGKVWDSVDNRMGQLVYDNLFWDRAFKDLTQASIRSVGWNVGTIREVGGGLADLVQGKLGHKTDYILALPITVGLAGGVVHYLYTGEPPSELKDYFFPRTGKLNDEGNPERIELPSYLKDVLAYSRHPVTTIAHKTNPVISLMSDMLNNEDYFGNQVRNPDDPFVQQLQQTMGYLATAAVPFGVRNAIELHGRGQSLAAQAGPMLGLVPAKREDTRTPAQNLMVAMIQRRMPHGATPEEVELQQARRRYSAAQRGGPPISAEDSAAVASLPRLSFRALEKAARAPVMDNKFKQLTALEAAQVWRVASAAERTQWAKLFRDKLSHADRRVRQQALDSLEPGTAP